MRVVLPAVAALFAVLLLAACTGGGAAASGAVSPPPARSGSLVAGRLPTVEYLGGPFLRHPTIHTLTFTSDDPAVTARLEHFGDVITTSSWWYEVTTGYCATPNDCIGAGRPGRHVRLADRLPAAVTDIDIELLLARAVAAGRFVVDADTLLIVYLPPRVSFGDANVPRYCDGPRALHQSTNLSGRRVPYAVVPRCGDVDQVTGSASHEILEATTNPQPARRGFAFLSQPASLGFTAAGFEPADPCGLLLQPQPWVYRDGFTVHRAWSNQAASRGANPCVPVPAEAPYLAVVPEHQSVQLTRVGASITIMVTSVADRPVGPWSVAALERAGGPGSMPHVDVSLDHDTVAPGQHAGLTVTLRRVDLARPVVVLLVSTLDGRSDRWPLIIVTGSLG